MEITENKPPIKNLKGIPLGHKWEFFNIEYDICIHCSIMRTKKIRLTSVDMSQGYKKYTEYSFNGKIIPELQPCTKTKYNGQ